MEQNLGSKVEIVDDEKNGVDILQNLLEISVCSESLLPLLDTEVGYGVVYELARKLFLARESGGGHDAFFGLPNSFSRLFVRRQ